MRDDIECPYCFADQEICHDDGQGYDEYTLHNQECSNCEKTFVFKTSISYSYEPYKADCLNGSEHMYKPTTTYPREFTMMECTECGDRVKPTEEQMKIIMGTP